MSDDPALLPPGFSRKPTVARVYNAGEGGENNYPADREVAEKVLGLSPGAGNIAGWNRAFIKRALKRAADSGIRQVVDIGAGIPKMTTDTTHRNLLAMLDNGRGKSAAQTDIRVVYVDKDPSVVTYIRGSQEVEPHVIAIYGDLARPGEILAHPRFARGIDLEQPVAVIMSAVLHLIPSPTAFDAVDYIKRGLVPGSWLIVSHATADGTDPAIAQQVQHIYEDAGVGHLTLRSRAEIGQFFNGWNLVEPGVVGVNDWWPDLDAGKAGTPAILYGAAAVKPLQLPGLRNLERNFDMSSRKHGRMASKAGLADMSLPAEERHRKRKAKGNGKGAIAQMDHGNGSKADKKRRDFQRKYGRGKKGR